MNICKRAVGPHVAVKTIVVKATLAASGTASLPSMRKKGVESNPITQVVNDTLCTWG